MACCGPSVRVGEVEIPLRQEEHKNEVTASRSRGYDLVQTLNQWWSGKREGDQSKPTCAAQAAATDQAKYLRDLPT